jgi:hypothetical protein
MAKSPVASTQPPTLQVFRHPSFRTIPERLDFVRGINASIVVHSSYQDSSTDPYREGLKSGETNLSTVHLAVEGGNRTLVPQRVVAVADLDVTLYDFVHFAEKKGRTDPNALFNIGLDSLMITSSKKPLVVAPESIPTLFDVVNGAHLGQMLGSVGSMAGVRHWEMWMSENPSDESSWRYYKTFFKTSKMLITGLESGKVYYFRIRGINSAGVSPWSVVVSVRAL